MNHYNITPGVSGAISLEDLKQSRSATAGFMQVSQTQFIDAITDVIEESGEKWNVGDIFFKNNTGRNPGVEILDITKESKEYQEKYAPVESGEMMLQHPGILLFKRLTGVIELPSYSDSEQTGNIAFSISQNGFELAVGNEVSICSNMCIMNADHRIASFGQNKMSPNEMILQLKKWVDNYKAIYEENIARIEKMKAFFVPASFANEIFGDLHRISLLSSKPPLKAFSETNAPIGTITISKGQSKYLEETLVKQRGSTNMWDIYNDITYNMKPDEIDTLGMIQQNASLARYLLSVIN